jgi:phosphoribosylformylglycinamidine (FGAM) synthase-like amidotransferase family enzyme
MIPVAHGEGQYFAHEDTIKMLNDTDSVLFRYCDAAGNMNLESNLNGSVGNIAGVCNAGRNVFGLMPHPERAADALLNNQDGLIIFESILGMVNA